MLLRRTILLSAVGLLSALVAVPASGSTQSTQAARNRRSALLESARESLRELQLNGGTESPLGTLSVSARCCVAMDYDPEFTPPQGGTGAVILYGGRDDLHVYDETWAWDGSTWQNLILSAPGPLRSTRMVWDAALHELVMFGGSSSLIDSPSAANHLTWLFYNSTWNACSTACNNAMPGIISPGLAYDGWVQPQGPSLTAGDVIEFGGTVNGANSDTTYAFDGNTWTQLSPTAKPIALSSPGMAFHPGRNKIVLFGGLCTVGSTDCTTGGYYGQTWLWDGAITTWTKLTLTNPPARTGHRLAYDPNLGTSSGLYLFGGQGDAGLLQDTWYLPALGGWVQCSGTQCATKPVSRCCGGLAYDARNAILTTVGGARCVDPDGRPCTDLYVNDTWTFNATGWHCVDGVCT